MRKLEMLGQEAGTMHRDGHAQRLCAALTQELYRALLREAERLLDTPADAEDAVQEALLRALLHCHQLRDEERLYPWLCAILRNVAMDTHRRQKRERAMVAAQVCPRNVLQDEVERAVASRERLNRLYDAVLTLTPLEREVIDLHLWQGMGFAAIARRLHVPVNRVYARNRRGMQRLRRYMDNDLRQ